jgi:hypothetical protein
MNESASIDDWIKIVYTVRRSLGVWSLYRHSRALHRSRDLNRIARRCDQLAAAEATRTDRPVKVVYINPDTGHPYESIVRPAEEVVTK